MGDSKLVSVYGEEKQLSLEGGNLLFFNALLTVDSFPQYESQINFAISLRI
ncbi:MAG: hypothetical protein ACI9YH_000579 [Colwellia sp.]|jgi:hypothetical protein